MLSDGKITEIFCMADDFCQFFNETVKKHTLEENDGKKHRNKPNKLSDAEIITIMIMFHSCGHRCLKHIAQIEHSRHRSVNNFMVNAVSAIAAYCFFPKKLSITIETYSDNQLVLF